MGLACHCPPSSTARAGSLPVSTNTFNLHPQHGLEVCQSLQKHSTFIHSTGWKSDSLYKHIQPSSTARVGSLPVSTNTFNVHPQRGLEVCQSLQTHSTFIHSTGWKSASLYKHIQRSSTARAGSLPVSTNTLNLHPQHGLEVCQSLQTHSTFIHSAGWKSASLYKHIQRSSTARAGSLPVSTNTFNLHPQHGLEVCQSLQTHSTFIHSAGWKSASLYKHTQPSSTARVGSLPVSTNTLNVHPQRGLEVCQSLQTHSTFIHSTGWKSASLYKHIQPSSTARVGSLPVSTNTFNVHPQRGLEVCQSLQTHSTFIHSAGWKSDSLYKHIQPSSTARVGSLTVSTNTFNLHPQHGLEVCQSLQTHSTFIHSTGCKSASLYKHIQPSSTARVGSLPISTNTFNLHPQHGLEVWQSLQTHSTFIHSTGWKSASLYKHIQPSSTARVGSLPVSTNTFNLHPQHGLEVCQSLQTHSTFIHSTGWKSASLYKHIQPSSTARVGSLTVSTNTFNLHPQRGLEVCQSLQTHSTFIHSAGWKSDSLYKHIQPSSTARVGSLPVSTNTFNLHPQRGLEVWQSLQTHSTFIHSAGWKSDSLYKHIQPSSTARAGSLPVSTNTFNVHPQHGL